MSDQNNNTKDYWFAAKRYGWGWGLPLIWKGWVTLILYFAFVIACFFIFPPSKEMPLFVSFILIISLLLIMVCWLKGEPPRWRWGKDKEN